MFLMFGLGLKFRPENAGFTSGRHDASLPIPCIAVVRESDSFCLTSARITMSDASAAARFQTAPDRLRGAVFFIRFSRRPEAAGGTVWRRGATAGEPA